MSNKELQQKVRDQHTHFTYTYETLDSKISQESENMEEKMLTLASNLDKKFSAHHVATTDSISHHHEHFTGVCNRLEELQGEQSSHHEDAMVGLRAKLETKFGDAHKQLASQVESYFAHFEGKCGSIESSVLEARNAADAAITAHRSAVDANTTKTTGVVQAHYEHFTSVCYDLDRKFAAQSAEVSERVHEQHKHFASVTSKLDQAFADKFTRFEEAMAGQQQLVSASREEFEAYQQAQKEREGRDKEEADAPLASDSDEAKDSKTGGPNSTEARESDKESKKDA